MQPEYFYPGSTTTVGEFKIRLAGEDWKLVKVGETLVAPVCHRKINLEKLITR